MDRKVSFVSKLFLYIALFPMAAFAAEILELEADGKGGKISQSADSRAFVKEDYLCVTHGQVEVACGLVTEAEDDEATIRFDFVKEPLEKGDKVVYAGGRYPASTSPPVMEASMSPYRRKKVFPFDITAGVIGGLNYVMPMAHFQGMISTRMSLGLMPVFFRRPFSSPTLSSIGGFFTVNYYTSGYFRGFWLGTGAGFYSFTASNGRPVTSGAALATAGYRFALFRNLNVGLAVGGQYINRPRTGADTFDFSEVQGVGTIDVGWKF